MPMVLIYGDTVRAVQAFDQWMPAEIHRVALVDTFNDEALEAVRVAQALGDRLWGVRLDTPSERGRVTPELVKEVRARLDQAGFPHVKIVVSGGFDVERIRLFQAGRGAGRRVWHRQRDQRRARDRLYRRPERDRRPARLPSAAGFRG